jgi:hypothetical protein
LLFQDGVYYDPNASPIANLFQVSQPDGREHFLLPILLSQVQHTGERVGEDGYVPASEIYQFAQALGYNEDQIAAALSHGAFRRLLDGLPRYAGGQERLHYRITTVGAYTVRVLLAYFAYVDAILIDTAIIDDQYRQLLQDVHSLPERLSRAEYFRIYLDRQWQKVNGEGLPWRWPPTSDQLANDIRSIGRRTEPETWGWTR